MECMSCYKERGTEFVVGVLLCKQCAELGKKAQREIHKEIERAREATNNWLQQHIMKGGLLRGGSGIDGKRYAGGILSDSGEVQELRSEEELQSPSSGSQT